MLRVSNSGEAGLAALLAMPEPAPEPAPEPEPVAEAAAEAAEEVAEEDKPIEPEVL